MDVERKKEKYICLKCGNVYESRAKKPECTLCRSKRKMRLEEFLALPEVSRNKLLGKSSSSGTVENKRVQGGKEAEVKAVEEVDTMVESGNSAEVEGEHKVEVKVESGKNEGKDDEIIQKKVEKLGEKVEEVKAKSGSGKVEEKAGKLAIPKPKVSLKTVGFIGGLVFLYFLYKLGYFESMTERLKRLGAFEDVKKQENEKEVEIRNPVIDRVKRNLTGD